MTRHPYGPDELDRQDPALDDAATRLEEFASSSGGEPPADLSARIRAAIEAEPPVVLGWWAALLAWRDGVPARAAAVAGVVVIAVAGALALGELARNARNDNVGTSPSAVPVPSGPPSAVPTPSLSPSPSESPTPTPTASPLPTERETPDDHTPLPTPTDDDDEVETPRPSGSDNSGPGGGGGGGSGSGGSSGPGG
jgi:uncharacterized membrane protein YgcG